MKIKNIIGITSFILSIGLFVYLLLINGWIIYWYSLGGHILIWHPLVPNDFNELTIYPLILTELYISISSIYFVNIGIKKVKNMKI